MSFLQSRRRMIVRKGRPMRLRRMAISPATPHDVPLIGYLALYKSELRPGDIRQGDAQIAILNDEIAALAWPGPPRPGDIAIVDGVSWAVIGSNALYEGAVCIGHDVHVRGGK